MTAIDAVAKPTKPNVSTTASKRTTLPQAVTAPNQTGLDRYSPAKFYDERHLCTT